MSANASESLFCMNLHAIVQIYILHKNLFSVLCCIKVN